MRSALVVACLAVGAFAGPAEDLRAALTAARNLEDAAAVESLRGAVREDRDGSSLRSLLTFRNLTTLYWLANRHPASSELIDPLLRRVFPRRRPMPRAPDLTRPGAQSAYAALMRGDASFLRRAERGDETARSIEEDLEELGSVAVLPAVAGLRSEGVRTRRACLRALRALRDSRCLAAVREAADAEADPKLRKEMEETLAVLGYTGGTAAELYRELAGRYDGEELATPAPAAIWEWARGKGVRGFFAGRHLHAVALAQQALQRSLHLAPEDEDTQEFLVSVLATRFMVTSIVAVARREPAGEDLAWLRAALRAQAGRFPGVLRSKPDAEVAAFLVEEIVAVRGLNDEIAVEAVVFGLARPKPLTRFVGARAMGWIEGALRKEQGRLSERNFDVLLKGLEHPDQEVRLWCLRVLLAGRRTAAQDRRIAEIATRVSRPEPEARDASPIEEVVVVAPRSDKPVERKSERVTVYYGTDRAVFRPSFLWYALRFQWAGLALALLLLFPTLGRWALHPRFARAAIPLRVLGWAGVLILIGLTTYSCLLTKKRLARVGMEYAGDRGAFDDPDGPQYEVGRCVVGIPKEHVAGEIERPNPLAGEFWEDPEQHIVLMSIEPAANEDAFFGDVRKRMARYDREQAFVFVHGFNVSFENAALRTAQMAYDLQFQGAPIFFSWPSRGGLLAYTADESTVAWSTRHLKSFLREVRLRFPDASIHLVAHSMGNRALTEALRRLSSWLAAQKLRFQEVILAAPDIDAATFRSDIAPAIRKTAARFTLYASSNDQALQASKLVHGYPRAGDSGSGILICEGVDTVDVSSLPSDVLGHSYLGSAGRVLDDLVRLLLFREPPKARGLFQAAAGHWLLREERERDGTADEPD